MVARDERDLRSEHQKEFRRGEELCALMVRRHDRRMVAMVDPHASGRGLRRVGVLKVLLQLVVVSVSAYREGEC